MLSVIAVARSCLLYTSDYYWNFRMGYSYYYLDQEGRALPYFHKALEKLPGDEDTQKLIDACESLITLPQFTACFRERTEDWWETFAEMEAESVSYTHLPSSSRRVSSG